jgi:peptidoglycan/LPS O-acetylase OafA/YrhL
MRMCRVLALVLALASIAYIGIAFSQQETDPLPLLGVGAAGAVLAIGAALPTHRRGWRWILVTAANVHWLAILGVLGLMFGEQKPMVVRVWLVGLLMAGLLLSLRAAFASRRRSRHGFHNYYDVTS